MYNVNDLGTDYEAIREKYPVEHIVKVFPLKAATRNRSTVIQMPGGGYRLLTTGAAVTVLHKCTQVLNGSGKVSTLGDEHRREIMEDLVHPMVSGAQRVLVLAYRYCENECYHNGAHVRHLHLRQLDSI